VVVGAVGRRRDIVIASLGAALLLVLGTLAVGAKACAPEPAGRAIAIDFSESIDSRIVHPMDGDHDGADHPASVDLRFPGGKTYHNEHATLVSISRGRPEAPAFIEHVVVNTGFATPEEAADHARRLHDQWSMQEANLTIDQWLDDRRRNGPGQLMLKEGLGSRTTDIVVSGRRLWVEYELKSDDILTVPYGITETFSW
jgi:hypothetical protein